MPCLGGASRRELKAAAHSGVGRISRLERSMAVARPTIVATALALALRTWAGTPDEAAGELTALAPQDIRWFAPSYYTDGRQRAHLRGDSTKGGAWVDRVKIPGGSRVLAHSHPDEEVVTVIEGTWYLGIGEKSDETRLKGYPAGSFIVIPAHVPHFLATREGPVIVQVSGDGVFRTEYLEK
jgi:quercetin dioxygenase-like cupin family protein